MKDTRLCEEPDHELLIITNYDLKVPRVSFGVIDEFYFRLVTLHSPALCSTFTNTKITNDKFYKVAFNHTLDAA